ncbi:hypothetical protein [Catenulispora acidiphila]|uniref:hypothetical protein n=1 Tax=Catenulispora acidiphila TaxID=304895 RepID=UPI0007C5CBB8|nr:hypothetical protein [Catenulispora acidiphila]
MSTRRTILRGGIAALGAAAFTGACDSSHGNADGAPTSSPTTGTTSSPSGSSPSASSSPSGSSAASSPSPSPSPTSSSATKPSTGVTPGGPSSPAAALWTPGPGELEPDVKAVAVEHIIAQLNRPDLQIYDAQYGGLLDTSASVLVVTSVATYDVRLVQASPRWRVTQVNPSQPGAPTSAPSSAATALLASSRVSLPAAAAADVRSGQVHDSVLNVLLELAKEHELAVSVVRSGHPIDVFGTTRPSDHPRGRAVDVWRIDGNAVVNPATPTALVDNLMRRAAALGSYNVGGPRQLSGPQFFSDRTHHDHVHMGFTT